MALPNVGLADSLHSDSQESQAVSSETVFSLDRLDLESIFQAIMEKEHQPLSSKISSVELQVYVTKMMHIIVTLILIGKFIADALARFQS